MPPAKSTVRTFASRARRELERRQVERVRRSYARNFAGSSAGPVEVGDRLVPSPVFLLSSIRSGSTLLRSVLDAHPEIVAPHEMHLGELKLKPRNKSVTGAQRELGLNEEELLTLLWDRVLHQQLQRSQKSVIVDKTPRNTFDWERIQRAWPAAKFVILLRHPEQIYRSMRSARANQPEAQQLKLVNSYVQALDEARTVLPSVVVRYEEFTNHPERETQRICAHLEVPWDAAMLDYGTDRTYIRGHGDWSKNIRSGKIQPAAPLPALADVPPELRDAVALLGY